MSLIIPKSPIPIFACRFACDYANEGDPILSLMAIHRGEILDLIHPWDHSYYWINDEGVLERVKKIHSFSRRKKQKIYAIDTYEMLKLFLWNDNMHNTDDDTYWEYAPLGGHFSDNMISEVELFTRASIELIHGYDYDIKALLNK